MPRKSGTIFMYVEYNRNQQRLKIPMRIVKDNDYSRIEVKYAIKIDEPCSIYVDSKNPEDCKSLVFKELDEFFAIDWKNFYLVSVEHDVGIDRYSQNSQSKEIAAELKISYRAVRVGTNRDGKKVHADADSGLIEDGDYKVGFSEAGSWGNNDMTVLVPATPENKAALDSIIDALHALAKRVERLMAPEKIQKTLLNSTKLLMAPPEKNDDR